VGCKNAQGFLEAQRLKIQDTEDARRKPHGPEEALALARSADRVVVARGKKVVTFDMKADPPDDETLLAHLLGPTGNLRAPTLRRGKTLVVGFSAETYRQELARRG
jgi:arsenate reductase-like glutaredoxin family protein